MTVCWVGPLVVSTSVVFSVLLAVAVNVATGGELPGPLRPYGWLAWPLVGVLAAAGAWLAVWQYRLSVVPSPVPASPGLQCQDDEPGARRGGVGG